MSTLEEVSSENCFLKTSGIVLDGIQVGRLLKQFELIPRSHLNAETIAGVIDKSLGRVKDGNPTGRPVIRFDIGKGSNPHINIDPTGVSGKLNPHIPIGQSTLNVAKAANKTLKCLGKAAVIATIAVDSWRTASSFISDIKIRDHAPELLEELDDVLEQLYEKEEKATKDEEKQQICQVIVYYEEIKKQVELTQKIPCKAIKTGAAVAGGWATGAAGAYGGGWAGAQTGALIGSLGGPIGTVVGGVVGGVVGSIGGGIIGGVVGNKAGQVAAERSLSITHDIIYGDK